MELIRMIVGECKKIDWLGVAVSLCIKATVIFCIALVLLIVFSSFCHAQSMRRDTLRNEIYMWLNTSTSGTAILSTARVKTILNQAIVSVCNDFPAYEKFDTIIANYAVEGQALPSDFLRPKRLQRMIGDTVRVDLFYFPSPDTMPILLSKKSMTSELVQDKNDKNIRSVAYYWITGSKLCLWPKYSKTVVSDSFLLEYYAKWTDNAADSAQVLIKDNYREALLLKACVLCSQTRKNWGDAGEYQKAYDAEILKKGLPRTEDTGWRSIKVGQ